MHAAGALHRAVEAWLAAVDPRAILPPRLAAGTGPAARPVLAGVTALPGGAALATLDAAGSVLAVPIAVEGATAAGGTTVRRAVEGDRVFEGLVRVLAQGAVGDLVGRRIGDVPDAVGERAIDVDQSNESVVVGERLVVKLFPVTAAGAQPGEELPAHLAAVGFRDMPAPFGSVRWEPLGRPSVLVVTVSAFLPGARDGWSWFLDLAVDAVVGGDPDASYAAATRCGDLVARFHAALATPSSVLGTSPVTQADAAAGDAWRRDADALLDEALAVTAGSEGEDLRRLAPAIRAAFRGFEGVTTTPVQRIHGDLHVGQILAWQGGDAVTDLDGNPLAPADERSAPRPAARDVASFARSLDHLARLVQRRSPDGRSEADLGQAADAWSREVRSRFLDGYADALAAAGVSHLYDARLLRPFEVAQGCHEYVYAARFLPRWLPVPALAMPRLLEEIAR